MADKPKLAVERVFERFREFATSLFDEVAEPRSLVLVVDWQIGQNDFPAGLLVAREKQMQPAELIEIIGQLGKMNLRILQIYGKSLDEAVEINDHLEESLNQKQALLQELQREIEELERQKRELQMPIADGTSESSRPEEGI